MIGSTNVRALEISSTSIASHSTPPLPALGPVGIALPNGTETTSAAEWLAVPVNGFVLLRSLGLYPQCLYVIVVKLHQPTDFAFQ